MRTSTCAAASGEGVRAASCSLPRVAWLLRWPWSPPAVPPVPLPLLGLPSLRGREARVLDAAFLRLSAATRSTHAISGMLKPSSARQSPTTQSLSLRPPCSLGSGALVPSTTLQWCSMTLGWNVMCEATRAMSGWMGSTTTERPPRAVSVDGSHRVIEGSIAFRRPRAARTAVRSAYSSPCTAAALPGRARSTRAASRALHPPSQRHRATA